MMALRSSNVCPYRENKERQNVQQTDDGFDF
jgi:ribosome modulation factor